MYADGGEDADDAPMREPLLFWVARRGSCGSSAPNMLGFLWRFIGSGLTRGWWSLSLAALSLTFSLSVLLVFLLLAVSSALLADEEGLLVPSAFGLFKLLSTSPSPLAHAVTPLSLSFGTDDLGLDEPVGVLDATGDEGAVAGPAGDGGTDDGGDLTEGLAGTAATAALVFVFGFFARVVRAFSSSSEEGYEPESFLAWTRAAATASCLASWASAP